MFAAMGYDAGGARGCGAWRRSRPSPSLTGRRFWARSAALRHGSFATTTRGSRTRSVLASPTLSCTCASGTFATRLERLLDKIRAEGAYRDAVDELLPQVEAAFTGPAFWAAFLERAHAAEIPRVERMPEHDRPGRRRAVRPPRAPLEATRRHAAVDLTAGRVINPIRASIGPRAYGIKNRARTNRMLMLMHLHANGHDDIHAYTNLIRAWLKANQGRPRVDRRAVIDPSGAPSLR